MLIAIDYDDTYTADPELWKPFLLHAKARGHRVICVTSRHGDDSVDISAEMKGMIEIVVPTSGEQKRGFCDRAGYCPDVWIDDSPEAICASCDFRDREEALC